MNIITFFRFSAIVLKENIAALICQLHWKGKTLGLKEVIDLNFIFTVTINASENYYLFALLSHKIRISQNLKIKIKILFKNFFLNI